MARQALERLAAANDEAVCEGLLSRRAILLQPAHPLLEPLHLLAHPSELRLSSLAARARKHLATTPSVQLGLECGDMLGVLSSLLLHLQVRARHRDSQLLHLLLVPVRPCCSQRLAPLGRGQRAPGSGGLVIEAHLLVSRT